MPLFKKDDKKKKSIPKDKIIKAVKNQEFLDLGEPFGENARKFLAYQLTKLIDAQEISGTVITPEGVYLSLNSKEVKDVVRLIKAKGICDLEKLAAENNWNIAAVKLIAKTRVNLIPRTDNKVITREAAKDVLYQKILEGMDVSLQELADELLIKRTITKDLLDELLAEGKVTGIFVKSANKFIPMEMLEESIKEFIETLEMKNEKEVRFIQVAEEYGLTEEQVYNILLKLYNKGEIDVQLILAQKSCVLKSNIKREKYKERVPEEEKKLEIEDLTKKK